MHKIFSKTRSVAAAAALAVSGAALSASSRSEVSVSVDLPDARLIRVANCDASHSTPSRDLLVPNFLGPEIANKIKESHGTPVYVYDEATLITQANRAQQFPNPFGLTVRFAIKASPNAAILQTFHRMGIHFDASSGYEVMRAVRAGVPPSHISLSSQEFPRNFKDLYELGIEFNACSLHQLEEFGKMFPGRKCGVRLNPGSGSGANFKTDVGGPAASFGIWYEHINEIKRIAAQYNIDIVRVHTHIGSGSDPAVWQKVATKTLELVDKFPGVKTVNLGGGYKVARMPNEKSTDILLVGAPVKAAMESFAERTGRKLKLEIEPGTFLVANAGSLLCSIQDLVNTGAQGYTFIKLDSGMSEIMRPSLYGAQHPIVNLTRPLETQVKDFVVVGHCCESGDLMTPAPGEPNLLSTRALPSGTAIGDLLSIEGAGAYCAAMSAKNYNSFPEAAEVMVRTNGEIALIRRQQTMDQIVANELPLPK